MCLNPQHVPNDKGFGFLTLDILVLIVIPHLKYRPLPSLRGGEIPL